MIGYKTRLERDLTRWEAAGILDAGAAAAIRTDMAARGRSIGMAAVLGILGAVLICFAAMTFVGANWQEIPKWGRLAILMTGLWGSYAGAWGLQRAGAPFFAQAAILLGTGLFGASIMLIAQMYHIDGNPPDAVLLWAAGTLLAAIALRSRPALALAIALFSLWSWWEVVLQRGDPHFPFLVAWAVAALATAWLRWRIGYHLLAIALAAWLVGLGYQLDDWDLWGTKAAHPLVVVIGLVVAFAGVAAREATGTWKTLASLAAVYGLAVAFAGLAALQFFEGTIPTSRIAILAAAALVLVIGALFYGARSDHTGLTRIAYLLFSIEILGLYFKTLGTLLDTALFFLLAGVLVMGLAWIAWLLHRSRLAESGA